MKCSCCDLGQDLEVPFCTVRHQEASGKGHQGTQAESTLWAERTASRKLQVKMLIQSTHR